MNLPGNTEDWILFILVYIIAIIRHQFKRRNAGTGLQPVLSVKSMFIPSTAHGLILWRQNLNEYEQKSKR